MRKTRLGLFGKIFIAIVGGIALGWVLGHQWTPCTWGLKSVNAFSGIFGQILRFIVPLLILGLVTPAIAETGTGARPYSPKVSAISIKPPRSNPSSRFRPS